MGLFGFSQPPDINKGIEEYQSTEGAVLLDVRNIGEYAQGHIEGSINIPLPCIIDIKDKVTDRNTPIFVYCLSGISKNMNHQKRFLETHLWVMPLVHGMQRFVRMFLCYIWMLPGQNWSRKRESTTGKKLRKRISLTVGEKKESTLY